MTDVSVIILVGKEERHIGRCLEKLATLEPRQIFVVESQKGDRTHAAAIATAHSLRWVVDESRSVESKSKSRVEERNVRNSTLGLGLHTSTTVTLVWHDWPGNQAKQFNWALENLPIDGEWILRLDADEYLTDETIEKLRLRLQVEVDDGGANSEQAARTPLPPSAVGLTRLSKKREKTPAALEFSLFSVS